MEIIDQTIVPKICFWLAVNSFYSKISMTYEFT